MVCVAFANYIYPWMQSTSTEIADKPVNKKVSDPRLLKSA